MAMRLINADVFDKALAKEAVFKIKQADRDLARAEARGLVKAREYVKCAPTVDAVPTVRCRQCAFLDRQPCPARDPETGKTRNCMKYCSVGERKDDHS